LSRRGRSAPESENARLWGLAVKFDTVESLLGACEKVRDAGFKKWDSYTPYPVHGLNDAMGIKHTKLPLVVLGAGVSGAGLALLMQWWMNAVDYKLIVSGKPFLGLPANIPVLFEVTVLLSATAAFVGMLAFNVLPQFFHPIFKSPIYQRVTTDRYVICVEAADPMFEERRTSAFLATLGGSDVERVEA
jgi:hypothetical protein